MVLVTNINRPPLNMWLVKKYKENFKDFNVKWNIKYKNDENHNELKF
jgi:hypothetical protein